MVFSSVCQCFEGCHYFLEDFELVHLVCMDATYSRAVFIEESSVELALFATFLIITNPAVDWWPVCVLQSWQLFMGVVYWYSSNFTYMNSPIGAINTVHTHKGEYIYTCLWDLAHCLFNYLRASDRKYPTDISAIIKILYYHKSLFKCLCYFNCILPWEIIVYANK